MKLNFLFLRSFNNGEIEFTYLCLLTQFWCFGANAHKNNRPVLLDPLSGSPHLLSVNKPRLYPKYPCASVCSGVLFVNQLGISRDRLLSCFSLYGPVMGWQPVKGVPCFLPNDCNRTILTVPQTTSLTSRWFLRPHLYRPDGSSDCIYTVLTVPRTASLLV